MIRKYKNGNVYVTIDDSDGTKTRFTLDDDFVPEFAECCDVHISNQCVNGCQYCYAGCSIDGMHGKLLGWEFFETLHPHTEMAINLQLPIPPDLIEFLSKMKDKQVIVNVTVNQNHFMLDGFRRLLKQLQSGGLIYGIGISLINPTSEFISATREFDNVVIHVINGVVTTQQLFDLAYQHFNILILGYKNIGRGESYTEENKRTVRNRKGFLYWNLKFILEEDWFQTIAFDNLALEQLNVKRFLSDGEWEESYQGDDGTSTFFINLVDGTFGINSLTKAEDRFPIENKSIDEMFKIIRRLKDGGKKLGAY